ncbi:MAG: molybdenum cofactor cytidylyltransferase [Candidatus Bathyarchaeia archaeon]
MISAVILAAGRSTRMGLTKQLLKLGDRSVIEHVISNVGRSKVGEIIVVLGYKAGEIAERIVEKSGIKIVTNPDYEMGLSTSLKAGIEETDGRSEAIIFVLGDQPLMSASTINKIVDEYERTHSLIVVPTYKGRRGHPVLIDRSLLCEVMKIGGDIGARSIIKRYEGDTHEVEVDDPGILKDFDTMKEFEALKRGWERRELHTSLINEGESKG